jgi:formylglycine-generating enzyme required for sulfatase activity
MEYTLPTEAQWEYACRERGEAKGPFHYGDSLSSRQANFNGNYPYGGAAKGRFRKKTTKVGSYKANKLGLYDMHGNVREWCSDWYGAYPSGSVADPSGPSGGSFRVLRGGSWADSAGFCRSAHRDWDAPTFRNRSVGFRLSLQTGD